MIFVCVYTELLSSRITGERVPWLVIESNVFAHV